MIFPRPTVSHRGSQNNDELTCVWITHKRYDCIRYLAMHFEAHLKFEGLSHMSQLFVDNHLFFCQFLSLLPEDYSLKPLHDVAEIFGILSATSITFAR